MWWHLVLVAVLVGYTSAEVDNCANTLFPPGPGLCQSCRLWAQYAETRVDYALENHFKSLHCCGNGYRSIEWFKDGVAYPWPSSMSDFMLYPEAANQTIYTQHAGRLDRGNYTCRLRNETHSRDYTVKLEIEVEEKPPDKPKPTFVPSDRWLTQGEKVQLYCEAFVGHVYVADAKSDIGWHRVWPDSTVGDTKANRTPNFIETKVMREKEDIVGAYLVIESMRAEDYGQYECVVRSNAEVIALSVTLHYIGGSALVGGDGAGRAAPWGTLVLGVLAAGALLASAAVLHARCTPRVALALRIARARRNPPARGVEKDFDVMVCWTPVDGELARGALLPTLTRKYRYRTRALQISTQPDTWYEQMLGACGECRSLVVVVSPALYSPPQLLTALKQLRALPLPPVIVLLQDVPKLKREAKDARGESLVSLLRRTRLIPWRHVQERAFWTALRLALPLPAPPAQQQNTNTTVESRGPGSYSRSGSMDALV